ncbi:hypothetical protein EXIGLDRAFT_307233 [Exidia glandulosa HHB12029]|uniref:Uncharacterized protein n=1 Tax=Exidia glandulosa HHB12029 TaxID=1314781 RepID=A0A165D1X2_EXIGL|nr:hypothetical protein EXIGLDRAFT_307233 [Exidia glandulosa HHB12029]
MLLIFRHPCRVSSNVETMHSREPGGTGSLGRGRNDPVVTPEATRAPDSDEHMTVTHAQWFHRTSTYGAACGFEDAGGDKGRRQGDWLRSDQETALFTPRQPLGSSSSVLHRQITSRLSSCARALVDSDVVDSNVVCVPIAPTPTARSRRCCSLVLASYPVDFRPGRSLWPRDRSHPSLARNRSDAHQERITPSQDPSAHPPTHSPL